MRRLPRIAVATYWLAVLVFLGTSFEVLAAPPLPTALAPVIITEVQAGSAASASQEFIELYNTTPEPIDLAAYHWQLQVGSSNAANWDSPLRVIDLTGVLQPGQSYVVASQYTASGQVVQYLPGVAHAWFSAGITATAGHIRLVYAANQTLIDGTCGPAEMVVDEVEWSAPNSSGTAATASIDGRSVYVTAKSSGLSPGSLQRLQDATTQYIDSDTDTVDFALLVAPSPGERNSGAGAAGSLSVASNVHLPADACSPAPPPSDDQPVDENTNDEETPATDDGATDDNEAQDTPLANAGLQPPLITELLPNPGSPQSDAADEFIELYNPNTVSFDLSGYALETGTSTTHRFTFPAGTFLPAYAYVAFFSATTGISLSNAGGQVRLVSTVTSAVVTSATYGSAKDNQAWANIGGNWQWTLSPSPNAPNIAASPAAKAVKAAVTAKAAAKAKAAPKPKAAKTKKAAVQPQVAAISANEAAAKSQLHPGVLAAIGVAAVLYGAYEYRQDMANYIRRRRDDRAARRAAGEESPGRRVD